MNAFVYTCINKILIWIVSLRIPFFSDRRDLEFKNLELREAADGWSLDGHVGIGPGGAEAGVGVHYDGDSFHVGGGVNVNEHGDFSAGVKASIDF